MSEYQEQEKTGFVIMLDILGFKELVTNNMEYNEFFRIWRINIPELSIVSA
ncbi:MAG: hypothetical protein P9L91_04430 [Candidatus Zophobacter franzmannii]|jgi:hypothetical protein|nr:hypothetical protein [Candidatus Zophobacter franzmannii]